MAYLLQASFCWIVLYALYYIALSKETFFGTNRMYLLFCLCLGLLLPTVPPPFTAMEKEVTINSYIIHLNEVVINQTTTESLGIMQYLMIVYSLGLAIALTKFSLGIFRIWKLYSGATIEKMGKYSIAHTDATHLPFSFFNIIFLSKKVPLKKHSEEIIKHELVHINLWHSLDIVFIEILHIFFWFNPILIFYKRSLKASHEYIADKSILSHMTKEAYSMLLIGHTYSGIELSLANTFFNSFIKNRITMMHKKESSKTALVKYILVLPLAAFLSYTIGSCKESSEVDEATLSKTVQTDKATSSNVEPTALEADTATSANTSIKNHNEERWIEAKDNKESKGNYVVWGATANAKKSNKVALEKVKKEDEIVPDEQYTPDENGVYNQVEVIPEFPGGFQALMSFLAENIKYPSEARDKNVEGTVVLKFEVAQNGSIENLKVVKAVGSGCDDEALRVMQLMNVKHKWSPGKVKGQAVRTTFTLPIKFKLS